MRRPEAVDEGAEALAGYSELGRAVEEAVRKASEGRRVAVAFSGGLDSGLTAAMASKYAESVVCYTCGTDGSFDVRAGRELAEALGLPWVHCRISKSNLEGIIRELISATDESDPFTISYELQLFCVCKYAEEDVILTGQGADEYLGGSAKFVGCSMDDYILLRDAGIERLLDVSVPCEMRIASYFGKELRHPYLDPGVQDVISRIPAADHLPRDMDSRKSVLKEAAAGLGYPGLAFRKKKSSQYGSGTTDLIRALAKEKGKMYNQYLAALYDEVALGIPARGRGSVINARVDPVVRAKAELILRREGLTPSEAVEMFYRKVIEDGGAESVRPSRRS
jgi:asparagine synthase (glutamine-hydrolysing)